MNAHRLRFAWIEWLSQQGYTYAITLKPNNPSFVVGEHFLRRNLDRFHRNLDRRLLGTRFAEEKNGLRRTRLVGVLEGLPLNGHIHAAAKIAPDLGQRFVDLTASENPRNPWTKMIPGGTIEVETIYSATGWHEYATKRFANVNYTDNIILLPR